MKNINFTLVTLILILVVSGGSAQDNAEYANDLEKLASWMTGSFSSVEQAKQDTSYYEIVLKTVPIWTNLNAGYWLYVEQAVAAAPDRPYRQRVYHILQLNPGLFESEVYTIEEPEKFIGAYETPETLTELTPDNVSLKQGCSIILRKIDDATFEGNTVGKHCQSTLHGARYAESEVIVTKEALISWDKGFDDQGNPVWGPEKAGYIFQKME
jgi:hypothetical protein